MKLYKYNGSGIEFEFKIDLLSGKIIVVGEEKNNNSSNEKVIDIDNEIGDVTIEPNINPQFYVCDEDGNKIDGFDAWFDNNLGTFVDRDSQTTLKVKWNGDIRGKQILIKTNGQNNSQLQVKYIDDSENVINAYKPSGETTDMLNWKEGEAVTYAPERATGILIYDYSTSYNIYEIQLFESGKFNYQISEVKTKGVTANKIGLKWKQDANIKEVKVYQDGNYLGTTTDSEYLITENLKSNTRYNICLEPVTNETTENLKNEKIKFVVTTKNDSANLYIEGLDEINNKYYANWFDANLSTYVYRDSQTTLKVKWNGDITGKQILIKTNGQDNYLQVKYINESGNVINAYMPSGETTEMLNWKEGEAVTYVPEGATGISVYDYSTSYNIYEIKILEDGMFSTNHITDVKATNIDTHGLKITWNKTDDITLTKIYQDGIYIGETNNCEYTINQGLLSNTEYLYYLEPVNANTTDGIRNRMTCIKVTTASNGVDFYIEGTNNNSKKSYKNWFDEDLSTCINIDSQTTLKVKWNGDITGKQILIKTDGQDYNNNLQVKYIDDSENVINAYKPSGETTDMLNWKEGEAVTYVPEGTTGILIYDYSTSYNIFEIKIVE